jgi:hypothetical protein
MRSWWRGEGLDRQHPGGLTNPLDVEQPCRNADAGTVGWEEAAPETHGVDDDPRVSSCLARLERPELSRCLGSGD